MYFFGTNILKQNNIRNIVVVVRLIQTEMTQTLTCSGNAENKARQEQNSAEDVRDVTKKDPDGGSMANERQRRHRQPPSGRRVSARGTPVRPHRRRRVDTTQPRLCVRTTSVKARVLQEDHESARRDSKEREFYFQFPMFWGQRWLTSLILNSQAAVFNFDTRRSFWLVSLRFWM